MTMIRHRRWLAALSAALVLFTVSLFSPSGAAAAASSSYIYLVDGEEIAVAYDPVVLKTGMLLPESLLQALGLVVRSGDGASVHIYRGSLTATLRPGSRTALVNGRQLSLPSAPVRMGDHLFVPAAVLPELGIQVTEDGNILLIDRWPLVEAASTAESEFAARRQAATTTSYLDMGRGEALTASLVLLNQGIVESASFTANPALRGRALQLLADHLLIEVDLLNQTSGFYAFQPASLYLVDNLGRQYRPTGEILPIEGSLAETLAPTAGARAILVFPAPQGGATEFKLYAQTNSFPLAAYPIAR